MAQIVNQFLNPNLGGFRHYSGLLPANPGDGGSQSQASVRRFHVAVTNAAAIFRGDIVTFADGPHGVPGAADLPQNIAPPSATPATTVIGNGGGSGLGNPAMAPNAARWVPGDTTSVIAGVCVGFGDITLYMAKNGFQFVPASFEAWLSVETDPQKRKQMVFDIDKKIQQDVARPILYHSRMATCCKPYVKNMTVMVNSSYNGFRYEDVWLDK